MSRRTLAPVSRLAELEAVIEADLAAFVRVGLALAEIREARLYKESHSSFEAYCRERWRLSSRHANRLIQGASVAQEMGPIGPNAPAHESQVRPLARLEPGERADAWQEAVEAAPDGQPTAGHVDEVVRSRQAREVLTSSDSVEWYTPPEIVEAARVVMGGIDLDPASCEEANEVVKARRIYTIETNGLRHHWKGRLLLNPPYGRNDQSESNQDLWTRYLLDQVQLGSVRQAHLIVNAATSNAWFEPLWDYPLCFPRRRLRFRQPRGGKPRNQPTQSSVIAYIGENTEAFLEHFGKLGRCVLPRGAYSEAA